MSVRWRHWHILACLLLFGASLIAIRAVVFSEQSRRANQLLLFELVRTGDVAGTCRIAAADGLKVDAIKVCVSSKVCEPIAIVIAKFGRCEAFQEVISTEAWLTSTDELNQTPLMWAAGGYADRASAPVNLDNMRFLVAHGANVNHRDRVGRTAIMIAAQLGNDDAVYLLLNYGADSSLFDSFNHNAAYYARLAGRPDLAALLESVPPPAHGTR